MWPELRTTVMYPPAPQRLYRCDEYGDYIFMVSRLTPLKRADLLVRALAEREAAGIKAVIAGEGEDRDRLHTPPHDEDYGFVTVEAFASLKAVVTCTDSGGPAELVADGVSGLVTEPTPHAIAVSLRRLMDDAPLAERMGEEGFTAGAKLNWADAVRQLTHEDLVK